MSRAVAAWMRVGTRFLPFADAASVELPLGRLLRLSLFQLSVGMTMVLLAGTLNRVMIVELGLPAALVALLVALPLVAAPLRALMGHRSDHHRSALGWRRVPYLWFGSLMMFGGLAIMPFAILVMTGGGNAPAAVGSAAAALAFLLAGSGMHLTQTAGLALATDLAPADRRPRVVAMLYVMLLVGMMVSALLFGAVLHGAFTPTRLVGVVQGAAMAAIALNLVALWKQEPRRPTSAQSGPQPSFAEAWRSFRSVPSRRRLLVAVGLGAAGFSMQDVLLEPFGAEVLGLSVGETTRLTALWAGGTLVALAWSSRLLGQDRGSDPHRIAAFGVLAGIVGLAAVVFSAPTQSIVILGLGVVMIGFGGGLFAVGSMMVAMDIAAETGSGLALGAWGAVQATAAGAGMLVAGLVRDGLHAAAGSLGPQLSQPATPYLVVWHVEIGLLFATLAALGPLVRSAVASATGPSRPFGLAEFPA